MLVMKFIKMLRRVEIYGITSREFGMMPFKKQKKKLRMKLKNNATSKNSTGIRLSVRNLIWMMTQIMPMINPKNNFIKI